MTRRYQQVGPNTYTTREVADISCELAMASCGPCRDESFTVSRKGFACPYCATLYETIGNCINCGAPKT